MTQRPRGTVLPNYSPRPHNAKSERREARNRAMPVDKGERAAGRNGPVNCYGKQKPRTPLEAAEVMAQAKGLKPQEGYTYRQMVVEVAAALEGLNLTSKQLVGVSGWKSLTGKGSVQRPIPRQEIPSRSPKKVERNVGAFSAPREPKNQAEQQFQRKLEIIRSKDVRSQDGRILTRRERRR